MEPKVLGVEDDPETLDEVAMTLEQHGYQVAVASDGLQGLAVALSESRKFDVASKAAGALLLPVILLLVGDWYTDKQKKSEEDRYKAERLTQLLAHLSSGNAQERLLTLDTMHYFALQRIPGERGAGKRGAAKLEFGEPKTEQSRRIITLPHRS